MKSILAAFRTLLPDLPRLNSSSLLVLLPQLQWCKTIVMKCQMKSKGLPNNEKHVILRFCIQILFVKTPPNLFPSDSSQNRLPVCPIKKT